MQNNVTELTQKLLRALDNNYNVIDMPAVIEIISLLEKVTITKELLETTRLGKHVNELRRNTSNESLAKRAKELVKKWRSMVLPDSNGQLKSGNLSDQQSNEDLQSKKRPAKDTLENITIKKSRVNGQISELEFSDNSNSSFKDVINSNLAKNIQKRDVIIINSDSNSSIPDIKQEPVLEEQQPKKRGRKKGSKNHKNLIDEAETSFSNKLNVSRGNAKVKTTQELLADLQIKSTNNSVMGLPGASKPIEDLNERAAKLTERVSIIDQKLNANSSRYKNAQKKFSLSQKNNVNERVIESGSFSNVKNSFGGGSNAASSGANSSHTDDEIIVVDELDEKDDDDTVSSSTNDKPEEKDFEEIKTEEKLIIPASLSLEEALAQLPPINKFILEEETDYIKPICTCKLIEHKTDFSIEDDADDADVQPSIEFVEDDCCSAKTYLEDIYHLNTELLDDNVYKLHNSFIPNVNGNFSTGGNQRAPEMTENNLYVNVVPNVNIESIPKFNSSDSTQPASENFKKYSISELDVGETVSTNSRDSTDCVKNCEYDSTLQQSQNISSDNINTFSDNQTFREWHEVVDTLSYNGEILKILPYVIID